ncbi:MAG: phospho-N-acetylmuramoyl-pentapeptide-transferase [Clostridiales bacterium]|jgi:phospho-N-acetylmuramoyl-pentapeptide-transferase|nr:phospho-N-acetylmuramoyl-pentapeptide-transferase [Clostridiales bacterium]
MYTVYYAYSQLSFHTAVLTALAAFGIAIVLGPIAIPVLRRLKVGQNVREDGPKTHLSKAGVPSMGGIIIVIAIAVASAIFSGFDTHWMLVMFLTFSFGIIGFLDDYIKIVKRRSLGLRAWQKFSLQILASIAFVFLLDFYNVETLIFIPFTQGLYLDLGLFTPFLLVFVVVGTTNGANFTDGMDGLASGVTLLVALFFLYVAFALDSILGYALAAAVGALLGFLLFNSYPARVFMGDTGSLALGGFVAACAIVLQMPLLIAIVAFVYVAEVLSVIIQVVYFKLTGGKRFFRMAPLHHHFEHLEPPWPETRVVSLFYVATVVFCLIGLLAVANI